MEWWDRRSGLSAVSPTDRDGRGHSPTDLAYVRGVHRDHRKWPITAPHSPLPVSRSRSDPPALSLSPFEDFERFIFRLAQVSLTGHERTWKLPGDGTTGWRFFSRHKSGYLHEFELGITYSTRFEEDCHVRFIIRVAFHIVFLEKGGGLMVRMVGRVRCLNRWFRKIAIFKESLERFL